MGYMMVIQWDLMGYMMAYPLVICYSLLLKMTIEIVELPIENGHFPYLCKSLPEGKFFLIQLKYSHNMHRQYQGKSLS